LILVIITSRDYQDERKGLKFSTIEASNGIYISLGAFFHQHTTLERRNIMKRLTIFGIIACIGLLFAPAAVTGAGPPGGLDVNVVNELGVTVLNDDTTPVPVTVQSAPLIRFVGFTDEQTTGKAGGLNGMNQLCQDRYPGIKARICTTRQWVDTGAPYFIRPDDEAWIIPTVVAMTSAQTEFITVATYDGGLFTFVDPAHFNCSFWTSEGDDLGWVIGEDGLTRRRACRNEFDVACCAPANR
jgi:hypothetical protein